MEITDKEPIVRTWLTERLGADAPVTINRFNQMSIGQSNETFLLDVAYEMRGRVERAELVLRTTPGGPGLVEPYDMAKQFTVMRALAASNVPVPSVRWLEEDELLLGRPFFVMDKLEGTVFEYIVPDYVRGGGSEKLRRMSENFVGAFADLHRWDWHGSELEKLDQGPGSLDRELAWWRSEMDRVKLAPLPAMERLCDWLAANMPEEAGRVVLHGDCKWGNIMWDDETVIGVLDWEMAQIGDPLIDIGYATMLWELGPITAADGSISADEFLALYEQASGIPVHDIVWYQALATFKVAAICLVGSMLFETGKVDSLRYAAFGGGIEGMVRSALAKAGVTDELEMGPVLADPAKVASRLDEVVYSLIVPELTSEVTEAQALAIPGLFRFYTGVPWSTA
jgi:aminoglycoside phosphotransferase (APT) family kinase protein